MNPESTDKLLNTIPFSEEKAGSKIIDINQINNSLAGTFFDPFLTPFPIFNDLNKGSFEIPYPFLIYVDYF